MARAAAKAKALKIDRLRTQLAMTFATSLALLALLLLSRP
jgi:hypothetical protein